jgi:hypothetical protein
MHVNQFKPNILDDMITAARMKRNGQANRLRVSDRKPKVYPYASERQRTRLARRRKAA